MSPDTHTTGAHRIVEYATSEQGKTHGKHGVAALAGAVAMAIPTMTAFWSEREQRDALEEALRRSQESYAALVNQMAAHMLEDRR